MFMEKNISAMTVNEVFDLIEEVYEECVNYDPLHNDIVEEDFYEYLEQCECADYVLLESMDEVKKVMSFLPSIMQRESQDEVYASSEAYNAIIDRMPSVMDKANDIIANIGVHQLNWHW